MLAACGSYFGEYHRSSSAPSTPPPLPGIGQALGKYTQGNATIIIAGRNRATADAIIAKLPKPATPGVSHEFIECDATLMKNVHATTKEILSRHPKINFLVMSPGYMTLKGRDETEEAIDRKLALNYYARWTFANGLPPALKRAKEDGEDAKVCSVLGAGKGGEIDVEDLGLKKSFSVAKAELAERNQDLTFIHGFVRTNLLSSAQSAILRAASGIISGLTYAVSTAPEDCAEYMWHGIFNSTKGAFGRASEALPKFLYL
ncbi:uncharacterized protein LACBIDRAFT_313216 [Laccaria bicolor S238N-H82]|uniref:Predicted protein n=1 Tax=Laccaria bicolor (strain S238N-H82 / ATCC MYA-4686) TaxID=486041 RepID=B0DXT4_LACBS|nr:uncharacterized protein LACBIDRAFT_313216 [Laccaria bicolor S238N-H82]EDR00567.1 predicted protein [Laccaria bicolor S238N-H82]|eukprot:XP_001888794.1 predicted protein [Laccaria bicolor S238N-H82]